MNMFADYLHDIGITGVNEDRVGEIIAMYGTVIDNRGLRDIFVTDHFTDDGNRNFGSLWLIYENYICEAKNFITETNFDCAAYDRNSVLYWSIQALNYDFRTTNDASRVTMRVELNTKIYCEMHAARNNCDHLMRIIRTYFRRALDEPAPVFPVKQQVPDSLVSADARALPKPSAFKKTSGRGKTTTMKKRKK